MIFITIFNKYVNANKDMEDLDKVEIDEDVENVEHFENNEDGFLLVDAINDLD